MLPAASIANSVIFAFLLWVMEGMPPRTRASDGGGLASTVLRPIEGAPRIARYALEISALVPGMKIFECTVNGQPGLVAQHGGVVVTVVAFDIADDRIQNIWAVRNPDKLRSWTGANRSEHYVN